MIYQAFDTDKFDVYQVKLPSMLGVDDILTTITFEFYGEAIKYQYKNYEKMTGRISRRLTDMYVQPILEIGERRFAYIATNPGTGHTMFKEVIQ